MRYQQMQLFTRPVIDAMRDRTKARNWSPEKDEFRRDHARRRRWGLQQRHALKWCRLHGCSRECAEVGIHDYAEPIPPLIWPAEATLTQRPSPVIPSRHVTAELDSPPTEGQPAHRDGRPAHGSGTATPAKPAPATQTTVLTEPPRQAEPTQPAAPAAQTKPTHPNHLTPSKQHEPAQRNEATRQREPGPTARTSPTARTGPTARTVPVARPLAADRPATRAPPREASGIRWSSRGCRPG